MRKLLWILCASTVLLTIPLEMAHGQETAVVNFCAIKAYWDQYYADLKASSPDFYNPDASGEFDYRFWVLNWQAQVSPYNCNLVTAQQVNSAFIRQEQNGKLAVAAAAGYPFVEIGPNRNMPYGFGGRMVFLRFSPQSPSLILTGSPVGGVYYSRDDGVNWQNGDPNKQFPITSVSDCAVHPTDSGVWFCSTGDNSAYPDGGGHNTGANQSIGMYCSLNAGQSWNFIGLNMSYWGWEIYRIHINPANPNIIYAATSGGLYETTNAMACDTTVAWTLLVGGGQDVYDVEFQPGSSSTLYASGNLIDPNNMHPAIAKSTNGGTNWNFIDIPPQSNPVFRVALAVTPAAPYFVYAVVIDCAFSNKQVQTCTNNADQAYLYRYDSRGTGTWTYKGPINNTASYGPPYGVHPSRGGSIGVSPTNADLIYVGDVGAAYCLNGTDSNPCAWTDVWTGVLHADTHEIRFSPGGTEIFAVGDGGVFQSTPSNTPWIADNYGIGTTIILGMDTNVPARSPTSGTVVSLGLYDNGTDLTTDDGNTWAHVFDGDGLQPMIDYTNPVNMYAAAQGGYRGRSADEGTSFPYDASSYCYNSNGNDITDWNTFSVLNSATPSTFYAGSCPAVMWTEDKGATFIPISNFGPAGDIWRVYTAPSNPDYLYAWWLDYATGATQLGHLWMTKNANCNATGTCGGTGMPTWMEIALPGVPCVSGGQLPGFPAGLAVDPNNENQFTLAYGGFCSQARVFQYLCNSQNQCKFENDDANSTLPAIGLNSLVAEPGMSGYLFVGFGASSAGIWFTNNSMTAWEPWGTGLPHTTVSELEINCGAQELIAGTYGRGTWQAYLTCPQ